MKKENKKKFWIAAAVGIGVTFVAMGAGLFVFMIHLFLGEAPAPEVTTDIAEFEGITERYPYIQSGLIVFPEEIPENVEDTDFYFSYRDTWDDPTCEIYLQCKYNEEDYEAEIERLENTQKRYGSQVLTLLRDEEKKFNYPAYIAVDNNNWAYEYALLTGEKEITYIYTSFTYAEEIHFDKNYLPENFRTTEDLSLSSAGYTIYYVSTEEFMGTTSINYDYTRDEVVMFEKHHWKEVGYNRFYVSVVLDENDNEIIADCSYLYYESKMDSINGLPEENIYTDLAGYQFVNLELNEEKTKAYVTYLDDGEEKVREYVIEEKTE